MSISCTHIGETKYEELSFAYMLGKLLMALYVAGSGITAVMALLHLISGFSLALVLPATLIMFIATAWLSYKTSKNIPQWLLASNSWWTTFQKSPDKMYILAACLIFTLAAGFTVGATTFSTTVAFFTILMSTFGISSAICPAIAIVFFAGMAAAATILLMKSCCDIIFGDYLKDINSYLAKIFQWEHLWQNVLIGIPICLTVVLTFFGLLAAASEGFEGVKEFLLQIPGAVIKAVDIASFCIAGVLALLGQLPFTFDTILHFISNFFDHELNKQNVSKEPEPLWQKIGSWVLIVIAALGDGLLAALGIGIEERPGLAIVAATGHTLDSLAQTVAGDDDPEKASNDCNIKTGL